MDFDTRASTGMPSPPVAFDLRTIIRSLVGANEYPFSSRLLKPFVRYCGNKLCPDERTNERGGLTVRKHNVFADIVS